ncbi:ATP-dependent DNA helicase [Variovorax sp.]|uniref:ATP-dependent DNA helicase n=1 Tax=Variovorax sp. TaxID=1871043 RepID=UPI002D3D9E94|nr:ATP-dependent DNA helicase [Variovorax sp.]HYP85939.1 ATP-dependent DNA helicase [Variovorax sp.]
MTDSPSPPPAVNPGPDTAFSVSVRALCAFAARSGDLDLRFTPAPTAQQGAEGHRMLQASRGAGYESEIALRLSRHGLLVRGRADGFDAAACRLDEIKTHRGPLARMRENQRALHWAQAKVYGAMLCELRSLVALSIAIVYLNIETDEETVVEARFTAQELALHADALCRTYAGWAERERRRHAALDAGLQALKFPQPQFRPGQRAFAASVYQAVRDGRPVLAQAPTGIGKTIASIYPALKARTPARLDKIFYLTAKTPGRAVALQALQRLQAGAPELRVVELSARERECVHPGRACHGDDCPLARGFFDRLPAARSEAAEVQWLDRAATARIAQRAAVCPYFLAQEMVRWADVVVADYNHYFDTHALLFAMAQEDGWRVAVLVDEVHNLVDRGRAMYSCAVDGKALDDALAIAPPAVAGALRNVRRAWHAASRDAAAQTAPAPSGSEQGGRFRHEVPQRLAQAVRQAVTAMSEHLAEQPAAGTGSPLLASFFELLQLDRLIETFDRDSLLEISGAAAGAGHGVLALHNLVPAAHLRRRWAAAHASVGFSATLSPFEFYRDTLGLAQATLTLDVPSPFHADQLQVRVAARLSGRARHRAQALPRLVQEVASHYRARPGNYLVFVGSLAYAEALSSALGRGHPDIPVWTQAPGMDARQRQAFLDRLAPAGRGIGVAVLGGAFGEGIDLPGDRLVGVFIAGLGIPVPDALNEQIRQRMEERFGDGYAYAYLYPGLQKVAQAAGRVIRTEQDRGTLVFLDDRYREASIQALLPSWWGWPALPT